MKQGAGPNTTSLLTQAFYPASLSVTVGYFVFLGLFVCFWNAWQSAA